MYAPKLQTLEVGLIIWFGHQLYAYLVDKLHINSMQFDSRLKFPDERINSMIMMMITKKVNSMNFLKTILVHFFLKLSN